MKTEPYPKAYLYRRIVQAKIFIDNNYADKIDLGKISGKAFFSKYHFNRLFKSIYDKTPHQYLTSVRLEKAQLLLKEGKPVSEVCVLVGFESLGSFSSLFKEAVGVSPTLFVSRQAARKKDIAVNPLKFIPGCMAYKNGWLENSNFEQMFI
jgi:AraC-like DNA-binding protein